MKSAPENQQSVRAFTLTELLITVVCVLVLVAISLPYIARPRVPVMKINCSSNLRQLGLAFRTWALDNNDKLPMDISVTNGGAMELINTGAVFAVFRAMPNELSTPKILICPEET